MKKVLFFYLFVLCIISHSHIVKISFSWPGIPYPLHGENGELIVWLGELGNMTPTPDGQYFIIRGAGSRLYLLNHSKEILHSSECFSNYNEVSFTPDGKRIFLLLGQITYLQSQKQTFKIFDYWNGKIQQIYSFFNVSVSPNPFSPDLKKLYFYRDMGIILDIETGIENPISSEAPLDAFFTPDGKYIVGLSIGDDPNATFWYFNKPYYLTFWNINSNKLSHQVELQKLRDTFQYHGISSHIVYICFNNVENVLIAIETISYSPNSYGMKVHIIDIETGNTLRYYPVPLYPSLNVNIFFSPNKKWLAYFGEYEPQGLIDITQELTEAQLSQKELYQQGPYKGWEHGGFNIDSSKFYFSRRDLSWKSKYALGVLDIDSNTITERIIDRRYGASIAALASKTSDLIANSDIVINDFDRWDYLSLSYLETLPTSDLSVSPYITATYRKDEKYIALGKGNKTRIFDASSWVSLGTVISATYDQRTHASFSNNHSMFLTASGMGEAYFANNLIRIWDAETFEMLREFRGHRDSVWYAEFSPDDRRIVSASLDGTAKVWDVASGNIVADFTIHNASVEYAAFFPDGERVLSIGKDRRALIWNVETTQVEKTLENLHFPAKLSPDGRHLFAGSEVWDIETGQIIKILDDFAQDYACLTLSPDGTQLLTSEEKGLTKIWNVPDHILKLSGIEHFRVYEEVEKK